MHLSVTSTYNSCPIFVSLPISKSLKTHNNKRVVSCKATLDFDNMLSMDASVEDIKKTYRKMALKYHPDVCEPSRRDECTMLFVKLQDTYRSMLDQASGNVNREVKGERRGCREWEGQLMELQRRSQSRIRKRDQSWGSRMRDQHFHP
ncbi:hypothetical protein LIER_01368 [Lithospermum erythrorhizon]|uniref:J domain-containing protein n=1 Tax=Lithospermum erythrorhizon TaxID=34254 RepID=A0AAV3NKL9_LITER